MTPFVSAADCRALARGVAMVTVLRSLALLWPPVVMGRPLSYILQLWLDLLSSYGRPMQWGRPLYFRPVFFFFLLCFSSLLFLANLSGRKLDVYYTSTHDVALVRI